MDKKKKRTVSRHNGRLYELVWKGTLEDPKVLVGENTYHIIRQRESA